MGRPLISRTLLAFGLIALLLAPARAEEGRYVATFDFWLGGLLAAEVAIDAEWGAGQFRGRSEMQTRGMLEKLYNGSYRVEAEGKLGPGGVSSSLYRSDSSFGEERQKVTMLFENRRPARIDAEPAFKPRPWEIDPGRQTGTLDPFAATMMLLRPEPARAICNRSVEIFDGRRRSRITLGTPEPHEKGLQCPVLYERVAGFAPKMMKKWTSWPLKAVFQLRPDGVAEIWEMTGVTDLGVAVARLRR